jgi:hypothetical protein
MSFRPSQVRFNNEGWDSNIWKVSNPNALKGHEGHHVKVRAHVDADKDETQITKPPPACLNLINPAFISSSVVLDKLLRVAQDLVHFWGERQPVRPG